MNKIMDPRDAIWNEAHELQYQVHYAEKIERALLARWGWLDNATKIAVAISSGSSAVTGLVFWQNSAYTFLWPVFTSASALLAIVSKQIAVTENLRLHAIAAADLSSLGLDIGTLIVRMKINGGFSVLEFEKKLIALRERYRITISKSKHDLLLTGRVQAKAQNRVDLHYEEHHDE
jgi:hypothetical protein